MATDPFHARSTIDVNGKTYTYFNIRALQDQGLGNIDRMPNSIRVLLEASCGTSTVSSSPTMMCPGCSCGISAGA